MLWTIEDHFASKILKINIKKEKMISPGVHTPENRTTVGSCCLDLDIPSIRGTTVNTSAIPWQELDTKQLRSNSLTDISD